jgi:hypothetical protein
MRFHFGKNVFDGAIAQNIIKHDTAISFQRSMNVFWTGVSRQVLKNHGTSNIGLLLWYSVI